MIGRIELILDLLQAAEHPDLSLPHRPYSVAVGIELKAHVCDKPHGANGVREYQHPIKGELRFEHEPLLFHKPFYPNSESVEFQFVLSNVAGRI